MLFAFVVAWFFAGGLHGLVAASPETPSGNRRAEEIARQSKIVQSSFQFLRANALRISNPTLRKHVLALLDNPAPTFYRLSPTRADKEKVFKELLARGFVKERDDRFPRSPPRGIIEGLFPTVDDPNQAAQPFWSAPGSSYEGHHSYPGGLVIHEAFNLRSALALAANYRFQYPGLQINDDFVIAAPLWHDAMKAVVFQWNDDESEWPELTIAGTGAHHILGIAEALHRKLPPRLVAAIAAAHGAPGFERFGNIVDWIEAAALMAHVDPIAYGVLKKEEGSEKRQLPWPVSPEAAINNLSDADFVFSIPAAHQSIEALRELAHSELMMSDTDLRSREFHHFRNRVFAALTQIRFYQLWTSGGREAVIMRLRGMGFIPAHKSPRP